MSLIPAFELSLCNAWIFIVPQILISIISNIILKRRETYESKEELARHTEKEKRVSKIEAFLILFIIFYSIFLPLNLDTAWFYAGFIVYWLCIIFLVIANGAFATTPLDKPVTKGVYRISRHPMNFGIFLIFIGIGIACVSWIFLLCGIVFLILMHIWIPSEEKWCLEKYGNEYREYMDKTPKWIGIPKSRKKGANHERNRSL